MAISAGKWMLRLPLRNGVRVDAAAAAVRAAEADFHVLVGLRSSGVGCSARQGRRRGADNGLRLVDGVDLAGEASVGGARGARSAEWVGLHVRVHGRLEVRREQDHLRSSLFTFSRAAPSSCFLAGGPGPCEAGLC